MSSVAELMSNRFQDLERQMRAIQMHRFHDHDTRADPEQFYAWAASAHAAIQSVFGTNSPYYQAFQKELSTIQNNCVFSQCFESIRGVFIGAKADVDQGYVLQLQNSLTGEVFGDLVGLSKAALKESHHSVACVLASAALEDALKRYASSNGIVVDGQTMEDVGNALKSKGLVSGAQKTLLSAMPKVRNAAMHADWEKLTPQDAGSVIGFVEQFLLTNF
ncbi:MAG: DUF4145 domain-containing protein [Candidatus Omnitrophica bacterium]|nr:DUF4145 domain-containing protein [Candidatus Omnitrophota bacterium]